LDLNSGTNKKLDWKCSTCNTNGRLKDIKEPQGVTVVLLVQEDYIAMVEIAWRTHILSWQRNIKVMLHIIIAGTNKKLDWKCKTCEHHWNTAGHNRVQGNGCPACANKVIH
jgi:DNA-directed RNA polymerase subunit RPC12/RpoP